MKKILAAAAVTCDLRGHVHQLPKGNEDIEPVSLSQRLGGTGTYMGRVWNGLHLPYELLACAGSGVYGDAVKQMAQKEQLPLMHESDDIQGCTYHLIDDQGRQAEMDVPGAEYSFDEDWMAYEDGKDYNSLVLADDLLSGPDADTMLETLSWLECPVFFNASAGLDKMDKDILASVLGMKPMVFLPAADLLAWAGTGSDIAKAAKLLQKETDAPVIVYTGKEGLYVEDGSQQLRTPDEDEMAFWNQEQLDTCAAAFAAAMASGSDLRNAVMFARDLTLRFVKNKGVMEEFDWQEQKQRLVHILTWKA